MKKAIFLSVISTFLIFISSCNVKDSEQKGNTVGAFRAPTNLTLPLSVVPKVSTAWSSTDDGFMLARGVPGVLDVPVWWQGIRPPAGEMVVLQIEYRDVVNAPVQAEVFSGLGDKSRSFSELHRFGGTGSGAWLKTRIPCPWDLACQVLPEATLRFRLISDGGDVPIRNIQLTSPLPEDEINWGSETREWVRRVQSDTTVDPDYYSLAQTPVLTGSWAKAPLVPFKRNWADPVLPVSAPGVGETDFPVSVQMATNEYAPVQLGIYANGRDLNDVQVSLDPIRDKAGKVVATGIVRAAEYSLVRSRIDGQTVEPFPQRLWPAYPFDVPAGRSHMVLIDICTTSPMSTPGHYSTKVRISARGISRKTAVSLEIDILPYHLLTMDEADLKLGGHIPGLIPEHDLAFQSKYNHNMIDLWYGSIRPEISLERDSLQLDFRMMDDWMAGARRQGFNTFYYFLGGNPYGFPSTMDLEKDLANAALGLDPMGWSTLALKNREIVPPSLAPFLVQWARRIGEHARDANWLHLTWSPMDEPAKWIQSPPNIGSLDYIKPHFFDIARLLKKGFPDAPMVADLHHYKGGMVFLPALDIVCTNATFENLAMPDEVRAAGKVFWEFSGCDDKGMPGKGRFTFGFYYASHDSRAAQIWAYNWAKGFNTLRGENWIYAWSTPFDVIPSPFMLGVREGLDDRRLIETLKRKALEKNVDIGPFLADLFAEVKASDSLRTSKITPKNLWDVSNDARILDKWNNLLREKLISLSK